MLGGFSLIYTLFLNITGRTLCAVFERELAYVITIIAASSVTNYEHNTDNDVVMIT